jgi:hypothetical protein
MAYDKDKIFPLILSEIEEGASLRSILRREDMPSRYTFFEWLHNDEEKTNQYARACEVRAETIFEEILEIADESSNDTIYTDKGEIPNGEWMARSRLRVDARKWMLGKMNPKKYGEKMQQEHSGEITTNIISLGNGTKPE